MDKPNELEEIQQQEAEAGLDMEYGDNPPDPKPPAEEPPQEPEEPKEPEEAPEDEKKEEEEEKEPEKKEGVKRYPHDDEDEEEEAATEPEKPEEKEEEEEEKKEPPKDQDEDDKPEHPYVHLSKHKKALEKRDQKIEQLESQLSEASTTKEEKEAIKEVKDWAEKYKGDPDAIQELVGVLQKAMGISPDVIEGLRQNQAEAVKIREEKKQDDAFEEDFLNSFYQLDRDGKPKKDEDGNPLFHPGFEKAESFKDQIKEFAFTDRYVNNPLDSIYHIVSAKQPTAKKTMETTRKGPSSQRDENTVKKFDEVTPEDVAKMDFDTYEQYKAYEEEKYLDEGLEVSRNGRRVRV